MNQLSPTYIYIAEFLILLIIEIVYIRLARRNGLLEPVSSRSSHFRNNIVTGSGFIFFLSLIAVPLLVSPEVYRFTHFFPMVAVGAGILVTVSFIDDIHRLSPALRLVVQTIIIGAVYYPLIPMDHPAELIMVMICGIGFVNAYNFMDGINGMLAAYSLVTLSTLAYLFMPLMAEVPLHAAVASATSKVLFVAVAVFAIFNFRKNAICFSGDVGSIMLGYLIAFITVTYVLLTSDLTIVTILLVYAVDTVYTILYRLFIGEDILTSHRLHLYQLLANKAGISHLRISMAYAGLQLLINIGYIAIPENLRSSYALIVLILLSFAYFNIRRKIKCAR